MAETLVQKEVRAGASPMGKIRINELARELEVKPNVILEMLPELGVTDKKTHSSSREDVFPLQLRRRLGPGGGSPEAPASAAIEREAAPPAPAHVAPVTARTEPAAPAAP